MKGWLSFIILLTGFILFFPGAVNADSATVQVNNLHVRSGPGLSDSILGKVHKNETFTVEDRKGDWLKIRWKKRSGWVAGWLVSLKKSATVVSKADYLRVRSTGSLSGTVKDYLMKNEAVTKIDEKGDWIKISRAKSSGWVHRDYLSTYSNAPAVNNKKSAGKLKVTAAVLNVRASGTTSSSILRQVRKNEGFDYIQKKSGWYEIKLSGSKTGWVAGWLVTTGSESSASTPKRSSTKISLEYNATNIRSGPSTGYKIVGRANKGEEFNVIAKDGQWFKVSYNNKSAYVAGWIVKETSDAAPVSTSGSLKGKTIILDAGHGGFDPGAIGRSGSYEKTLTLKTVHKLKADLESNGAKVVMTRSNDSYVSLALRTSIANAANGDAFISLHFNSVPSSIKANGISTFFYSSNSSYLASLVQSSAARATGQRDRGIINESFHLLRYSNTPAVLMELGFTSDVNEEKMVKTPSYQNKVSQGITNGLIQYFN
ncbi:N-acetylmuramoyl-L-alanine amidase [Halobacillus massiliensis]|uniref:N-acetylmuramoyl-L-alanine amidase n=1 Tax=Halobacillus massiliensis TaxID=1926286 RepID=UPI0009E59D5B|nr:N-acetylmuramoyl-L-alanine amidase [Halobacillus massiliensis]